MLNFVQHCTFQNCNGLHASVPITPMSSKFLGVHNLKKGEGKLAKVVNKRSKKKISHKPFQEPDVCYKIGIMPTRQSITENKK